MALADKSLFLYGFTVDTTNMYLPFQAVNAGPEIDAVIPASYYTLQSLCTAIALAMNTADPANTYTVSIDRTLSSNTQNRITIASSGSFLSLLFSSGTVAATSIRDTINFGHADLTGATSYQNSTTSGTSLQTAWYGFNYQDPRVNLRTIGAVNVSASGVKEGIWWSVQQFLQVEFRFEAQAAVLANWAPLITWMSKQRPFEITPEVKTPGTTYSVTLEKSAADGKGMGVQMKEMIPDFPLLYATGQLEMRILV